MTVGPAVLMAGAYTLSYPSARREAPALETQIEEAEKRAAKSRVNEFSVLTEACEVAADELRTKLPSDCRVIARTPFVVAGDVSEEELDRLHRDAILPVMNALWRCYFDRKPDQPITIVALSREETYREAAQGLDNYEPTAYAGYTQRGERRIVLNLATGRGTLTHELSHVLALFDFPEMPEWFDEGLAALHEEAVFSDDGLILVGTSNWRMSLLRDALRQKKLPALESVIRTQSFRGEGEGLNYALVRCFCLYLQDRGLLSHYYRKFRSTVKDDPSGINTLCELLEVRSGDELDIEFRAWLQKQGRKSVR